MFSGENEESQQTMAEWMSYCSEGIGEQDFSQILSYTGWLVDLNYELNNDNIVQLSAFMFHNNLWGSVWRLNVSGLAIVFLKTHHTSQPIRIFPKNEWKSKQKYGFLLISLKLYTLEVQFWWQPYLIWPFCTFWEDLQLCRLNGSRDIAKNSEK